MFEHSYVTDSLSLIVMALSAFDTLHGMWAWLRVKDLKAHDSDALGATKQYVFSHIALSISIFAFTAIHQIDRIIQHTAL